MNPENEELKGLLWWLLILGLVAAFVVSLLLYVGLFPDIKW